MANIKKRGNSYLITVSNGRDINGKQLLEYATFTPDPHKTDKQNEKALTLFAVNFEEQVKQGKLFKGDKITFSRFYEIWHDNYAEKQYDPTTLELTERIFKDVLLPSFGHLKVSAITPLQIQKLYDNLMDGGSKRGTPYKATTIRRFHNILSSCLNTAVYWQVIDDNPCKRVRPPKIQRTEDVKHFTLEEAQTFLDYLNESYAVPHGGRGEKMKDVVDIKTVPLQFKVFFNLALYGGFRRGELLALTWQDVNFDENTIEINKSLSKTQKDGVIIKNTKSKSSDRIVAMPEICMKMLKNLRRYQREQKLAMGTAWQGHDNVFSSDNGDYMDIGTPNKNFQRIIRRYNSTHEDKLPVITLHGLRHTSATLLISQNNDIKTVSARLGHADVSTTLNIYTHALKERDRVASESLSILFKEHA